MVYPQLDSLSGRGRDLQREPTRRERALDHLCLREEAALSVVDLDVGVDRLPPARHRLQVLPRDVEDLLCRRPSAVVDVPFWGARARTRFGLRFRAPVASLSPPDGYVARVALAGADDLHRLRLLQLAPSCSRRLRIHCNPAFVVAFFDLFLLLLLLFLLQAHPRRLLVDDGMLCLRLRLSLSLSISFRLRLHLRLHLDHLHRFPPGCGRGDHLDRSDEQVVGEARQGRGQ
mmetsp:Transcript_14742/g.35981  ORF Transcript_14742/g.35981 Transcript_14742/m.35981 type:complete len:231 (+) Transcript_14742:455-1147(+)